MNVTSAIIILVATVLQCITFYYLCKKDSEVKEEESSANYWRKMARWYSDRLEEEKAKQNKSKQIQYTITCDTEAVVKEVVKRMKEKLACLD